MRRMLSAVLIVLLPFFLLIRTSTYLYLHLHLSGWLALGAVLLLFISTLSGYAVALEYRLTGRLRLRGNLLKFIAAAVTGLCLTGLFYSSSLQTKNERVRTSYTRLHPIMRLTLATLGLADRNLLMTDARRNPEDYRRMGLRVRSHSLHYEQADGYVHAADLRTIGRPEWKNLLLEWSLRALGFDTLRHTGTADHLHVSLPVAGPRE